MRLFTAIELDDVAREAVAAAQQRIRVELGDASRSLRFVASERLHLTLIFLGEVAEGPAAEIIELMRQDIPAPAFELVFGGIGTFPPRGTPRVVWLGARDGARQAIDLQAAVAARLAGAGVVPDSRPFRPHLTLARWRDRCRGGCPVFSESSDAVARVTVVRATLFQSRLSPAGPTYTPLAHAHLTCR
jgi:RNA 2',3'-cyclic 3'-phosphodiesterase